MKKTNILLYLSAYFVLLSCEKTPEPTGDFTYTLATVFSPVEVTFTADYSDADTYTWDFGNDEIRQGQIVTYKFTEGLHTVTLKASGPGGETKTTKTLNIPGKATKMNITGIDVNRFPSTKPDGSSWDIDPGSNPDIYITAGTENKTDYAQSVNIQEDAVSGKSYPFEITYSFTEFDKRFYVNIYDLDPASSEFVGGLIGYMEYYRLNGYPESFDMVLDEYSFTVYVKWE
ncbi:PKD domain-containing protein [Saccharicrinis sp. FJH54]|uniref:PKD domain-containing protein n=1 Tax=Saccharicrinis sp. FJH54 TaxID=3344665 RepID=UPI0035D4511E